MSKKSKLKIIPLGGLGEIGKNITVFEYENDIIVVDCGIAFPDEEMPGVDFVIPDFTYLVKNKDRIRGILTTHGHEDHIGSLPFLLSEVKAPVYGTKLTLGILSNKLKEKKMLRSTQLKVVKIGSVVRVGAFTVEFVGVNHSIPDSAALCINTPVGTIFHTGDFKIDTMPIAGEMINLARISEIGRKGVLLLMSESTNVERPGYSMGEHTVGAALDDIFKNTSKRIIIATFASNVHRVQQIIDAAAKVGRKVAVNGRSMENVLAAATELGYTTIPENTMISIDDIGKYPDDKVVIITTGSQGESMSALSRMAFSDHRKVVIGPGDLIVISANPIPGNEKLVSRVINELFRRGANVIYEALADIHVSGHAFQEELKLIFRLINPKYFMPIHGEYRHLKRHADIIKNMGFPAKNIFISSIGKVMELDSHSCKFSGIVPSGKVLVDGLGVGDVGNIVLRDRKHLAQDGLIIVVVTISGENGAVMAGPDVISRGFVYVREAETLMEDIRKRALKVFENDTGKKVNDWNTLKSNTKNELSDFLYEKTKRKPMILPIIMEV